MINVRYVSVNLSPILSRNEKIEQNIRNKTHKPNALRFSVEGGVILLCGLTLWDLSDIYSSVSLNLTLSRNKKVE